MNAISRLNLAVEQITHFSNSFHVPELHSLYPGWAICQAHNRCTPVTSTWLFAMQTYGAIIERVKKEGCQQGVLMLCVSCII